MAKQVSNEADQFIDELKESLGTEGIFSVKEHYQPKQYKRPSRTKESLVKTFESVKALLIIVSICLLLSLMGTLLAVWVNSAEEKPRNACIEVDYNQLECID